MDFAATALWAVIVATIFTTIILGGVLFAMKTRLRRRTRERVRSFLWELVRGVEAGTVEEAVLRRLVYGSNADLVLEQQQPKLYEVSLRPLVPSAQTPSSPTTTSSSMGQAHDVAASSPTRPNSETGLTWSEMALLSLSQPLNIYGPAKDKRKSISVPIRWSRSIPQNHPLSPLLHSQQDHLGVTDTPQETIGQGNNARVNPHPEGSPTSEEGTTGAIVGPSLHFERRINAAVIIIMPFQSQQARRRSARFSTSTIPPVRTVSDLPISLASATPVFEEDALHPIVSLTQDTTIP
ncbi:hypothetical protein FRC17_010097 [Serendipita sp. 399]|nr:hypothetical protein FRC17_010097 [Serendipita sp. 399]